MGTFVTVHDLTPFATIDAAKAEEMIADAEAMAMLAAPCLGSPDTLSELQNAAVKAVVRGAILRWDEAGTGIRQSITTGPFGETTDTTQQRRGMFWPSEITSLQGICGNDQGGVYSLDLSGPDRGEGFWSAPNTWVPL
jgi:hypothetical protein